MKVIFMGTPDFSVGTLEALAEAGHEVVLAADFVFIPKPEYKNDYPALIVELKWNQNAQTAMEQIKEKKYPSSVLDYTGNILLVAINYDKATKEHQCIIEEYEKAESL